MKKPKAAARPGTVIPGGPMVPATGSQAPAPPSPQQRIAARKRHQAAVKAAATRRKHAAAAKKAGKKQKPRRLALGEGVACCAAEALAASLRLAGWTVTDADVLALYELTADGPDEGATIEATLEAAAEHPLAGAWPLSFGEVMPSEPGYWPSLGHKTRAGLILGLDLPGPHAVYDDGTAWWSWGEPFDPASFPGAVIEEAWAVTW